MNDLTVVMLTPNKVPALWAKYHRETLEKAIGDTPIITVSVKPMKWGINIRQKKEDYGVDNIYRMMLKAFKLAKTPYVAMADDDTLYHRSHFEYRPEMNVFAYDLNRWHIFTWGSPFYFHKPRPGNGLLICSRELAINALEARFKKFGKLKNVWAKELGANRHVARIDGARAAFFHSIYPVLSFYHEQSFDKLNQERKKFAWPVRAYDLPYWRKAKHIRSKFS